MEEKTIYLPIPLTVEGIEDVHVSQIVVTKNNIMFGETVLAEKDMNNQYDEDVFIFNVAEKEGNLFILRELIRKGYFEFANKNETFNELNLKSVSSIKPFYRYEFEFLNPSTKTNDIFNSVVDKMNKICNKNVDVEEQFINIISNVCIYFLRVNANISNKQIESRFFINNIVKKILESSEKYSEVKNHLKIKKILKIIKRKL